MAEGIEILISLEDKLSGPIKNIIKNLENLKKIKDIMIVNFEKFSSSISQTSSSFNQMNKQTNQISSSFDNISSSSEKVDGSIAIMEEGLKGTEKIYEDFSDSLYNSDKIITKMDEGILQSINNFEEWSDATDNSWKAIMKFDEETSTTIKTMADAEKQGKRFKMQWLGIGFLGMQLSRTFGFLNKTIMDTYFAGELMNIQLTMIWSAAPYLEPLVEVFYSLVDIFYALPESIQGFLGVLFPLISTFGSILSQVGFMAIGFSSLMSVLGITLPAGGIIGALGGLSAFLIPLLPIIAAIVAAIVILWIAWQTNFANIRQFAQDMWNAIVSIFSGAWKMIEGIMDIIVGIITLDWDKIIAGCKKFVLGFWELFVNGFGRLVLAVVQFGIRILQAFWDWLTRLPGFIWEGIQLVGKVFSDFFTWVVNGAMTMGSNFVKGILEGIRSLASQVGTALWNLIPEPFRGWIQGVAGFVGGIAAGIANFIGGMFPSYQMGGRVKETGLAYVHKGETVVPTGETLNFAPVINISANLSGSADINSLGKQLMNVMYDELRRRRM